MTPLAYPGGPISPDMRNLHHKRKTKTEGGFRRDGDGEMLAELWGLGTRWRAETSRVRSLGRMNTGKQYGTCARSNKGVLRRAGRN